MITIPKKSTLGRVHLVLGFERMWECRNMGWRRFNFGVFYLRKFPPDGEILTRKHYTGFWFRIRLWFPFELD